MVLTLTIARIRKKGSALLFLASSFCLNYRANAAYEKIGTIESEDWVIVPQIKNLNDLIQEAISEEGILEPINKEKILEETIQEEIREEITQKEIPDEGNKENIKNINRPMRTLLRKPNFIKEAEFFHWGKGKSKDSVLEIELFFIKEISSLLDLKIGYTIKSFNFRAYPANIPLYKEEEDKFSFLQSIRAPFDENNCYVMGCEEIDEKIFSLVTFSPSTFSYENPKNNSTIITGAKWTIPKKVNKIVSTLKEIFCNTYALRKIDSEILFKLFCLVGPNSSRVNRDICIQRVSSIERPSLYIMMGDLELKTNETRPSKLYIPLDEDVFDKFCEQHELWYTEEEDISPKNIGEEEDKTFSKD